MKKTIFLLALAGIFFSCEKKYSESITYRINEPVVVSAQAFLQTVKVTDERRPISDYGKICFYNGFIYISAPQKGIHIIDNSQPKSPRIIGFIELTGNADIAIRGKLLYADSYSNLLWFDISNPAKPALNGFLEDVFPGVLPPVDNEYGYDYYAASHKEGIIVGWKLTEKTETMESANNHQYDYDTGMMEIAPNDGYNKRSTTGINGSMSRFSIYKDYLYAVINNQLSIFDLSGTTPSKAIENNYYIGYQVETIFSYKDKMFMGTPTGMLIYSVAEPTSPSFCSVIAHAYGCDPVVVENDLAYVTIHSGNVCGQSNNELFVIDVKDVYAPRQLASYAMTSPKGLGIDNGTLFVCDDGLKIFNADNPQTILANQLAHYTGMEGYDVIPFGNTLMMIAQEGLYQYDYSDLNNIRQLSLLPISR